MSLQKIERLTVLVADDDQEVRKIIIDYLTIFGFKVFLEAKDGSEAFRHINDSMQKIDLIISDWEMPRTDGFTLLRAVRGHRYRSETPFIMVTSQQSQERLKISNAKKHKVDCYIVKPFRAETLREKVWLALKLDDYIAAG